MSVRPTSDKAPSKKRRPLKVKGPKEAKLTRWATKAKPQMAAVVNKANEDRTG
jgi:hypothetical protein